MRCGPRKSYHGAAGRGQGRWRNLLPLGPGPELVVIDHQDLRLAPAAYDAAALLNDSLYPPEELALSLLGDLEAIDYHRCAVQRTLKIIGTFVKFARAG